VGSIREVWVFANNIIRSARQLVNEALKPLNLSSAEGNILLQLLTQGDGVRQEELVEQLDITKPAVSRALDSLESKGYVLREKDYSDRRAALVLLTEKARQTGPQVEAIYDHIFTIAADGIAPAEIAAFADLFARVSRNFSEAKALHGEQGRTNQ
jgi:DNA-binding MarR family transcriptional regulator